MGGYGPGGHNRAHDYTSRYRRLDSFDFCKLIPLVKRSGTGWVNTVMDWTDGSSASVALCLNRVTVCYSFDLDGEREEVRKDIYFAAVDNNYGGAKRLYFCCPFCGRRSRILYMHRQHFKCRLCAQLNYTSQQMTKGAYAAAHRMDRFLRDKFKVTKNLAPAEAVYYQPDRPKGMHMKTYTRLLLELAELQVDYDREWLAGISRVLGPNFYK